MERFISMSVEELEALVSCAGVELEDAVYPLCCKPSRGPLRIRECDRGGVKIEVSPRRIRSSDNFVISVLFDTGICILGNVEYLAGFLRGPIAKAFGIECEPLTPSAVKPPPEESSDAGEHAEPPSRRAVRPGVVRKTRKRAACPLLTSSRPRLHARCTGRTPPWPCSRGASRRRSRSANLPDRPACC